MDTLSKHREDTLDTTDKPLLNFENIENTPFTIVEEEGKYFGVIGEHRITEEFYNKELCEKECIEISWNRIVQVMWAIASKVNKIEQLTK